jgi:periplasmic copper chaperone A
MTMKKHTIPERRTVWMRCMAGLLFAVRLAAQDAAVTARDAWVRVPLPSKTETALYMVIENHSTQRRAVVSASSDAAAALEMHEMKMVKMVMQMTPVAEIGIKAKGKTSLNSDGP